MYNFSFRGRSTRAEYWTFYIANLIAFVVLSIIVGALNFTITNLLFLVWLVMWMVAGLAMAWRRCHDINMSGVLSLAMCIPVVGFAVWLYIGLKDSYPGVSDYED